MFEGFGMSGAILVRPGRVWNAPWLRFRASGERLGGVLGPSWSVLGGSWRGFGESWRLLGSFLGAFSEVFMPFRAICESSKKHRKTNGFSLIFVVSGGFEGSTNQ